MFCLHYDIFIKILRILHKFELKKVTKFRSVILSKIEIFFSIIAISIISRDYVFSQKWWQMSRDPGLPLEDRVNTCRLSSLSRDWDGRSLDIEHNH